MVCVWGMHSVARAGGGEVLSGCRHHPSALETLSGVGCVASGQCCPSGPQFPLLPGRATGRGSSKRLVQP